MSREEVRKSLDYAFEGIRALIRNDPLPPPRPGTYRVRIRVPEDYRDGQPERWTALADVFAGQGYDYHTIGFAVEIEFGPALDETLTDHLAPWFRVPGDDALDDGVMRRCLLCGRTSAIVEAPNDAVVKHEPDCAFATALVALHASISIPRDPEPSGRDPLT